MAKQYTEISDKLKQFIEEQKIFFVGTAASDGRVNISPKGMDSLRIVDKNRVVWLNVTGSGNETSAHIQENSRMTIMFTAFEGEPTILRLYGNANIVHKSDSEWSELLSLFKPIPGARQIFVLTVDLVQISCGMAYHFLTILKKDSNSVFGLLRKVNLEYIVTGWIKIRQVLMESLLTLKKKTAKNA